MAAVEATALPRKRISSFRSQRTRAVPEQSLFGTTLEHYNKEGLQKIDSHQASVNKEQHQPEQYPVPDHLKESVTARAMVEKAYKEVETQSRVVTDMCTELEKKERRALMFKPDPTECLKKSMKPLSTRASQELEQAEEINRIGLNKYGSYNHDKYGKKPPAHNYSLIGDLLSHGNDFGQLQRYSPDNNLIKLNKQSNNNVTDEAIRLGFNSLDYRETSGEQSNSTLSVPANIKHQVGSRVCEKLLSDKKGAEEFLQKLRENKKSSERSETLDTKHYEEATSTTYFDLGYLSRANIFPYHSVTKPQGIFKAVHSAEVYLRREPMTNEFRRRHTKDSKWMEQNIIYSNLRRLWQAPKS